MKLYNLTVIDVILGNDDLSNCGHVRVSIQSASNNVPKRSQSAVHVTRPNDSTTAAAAAADFADLDLDFLDLPVDVSPRLKRYPSARAASIWRHK